MSMNNDMPDIVGKRLIVATIDALVESNPDRVCFSIPQDDRDLSKGFRDITCRQFANAINHAAHWLESTLPTPDNTSFEVIGYQGPNDLRYPILAVAAAKVGKQIFLPSLLAPLSVRKHLVHSSVCTYYLYAAQAHGEVEQLLFDSPDVQSMLVPELSTWLNSSSAPKFSFTKTYDEAKDDPWIIFHTSGTTGLPKPIIYTQRMMTAFDVWHTLPGSKEKSTLGLFLKKRVYGVTPLSHVSGMIAAVQGSLFLDSTLVIGPATNIPTPDLVSDILQHSNAVALVSIPSVLKEMVRRPEHLEVLGSLDFIQYIGAPLDTETGNLLSNLVTLCPAYGSTETGPYFLDLPNDKKDWKYLNFLTEEQGITFINMPEYPEGVYEITFSNWLKHPWVHWQGIFEVFPNLDCYDTKDFFKPHPTIHGLWEYVGRFDDLVILAGGAYILAPFVEEKIMKHPNVNFALVGGNGRKYPFAIIEPTAAVYEGMKTKGENFAMEAVWPAVLEANQALSENTRIRWENMLIAPETRPLLRNAKGTLLRGDSLRESKEKVDCLYFYDSL